MVGARRNEDAAPRPVRLHKETFLRLCEAKGAHNEIERARLAKVGRNTVARWLKGKSSPLLTVARELARTLESTVDDLWPEDGS